MFYSDQMIKDIKGTNYEVFIDGKHNIVPVGNTQAIFGLI